MDSLETELLRQGWALLPQPLDDAAREAIKAGSLPDWADAVRERLQAIAQPWGIGRMQARRPLLALQVQDAGQALPLMASETPDGFALHLVMLLSAPGRDFDGGHTLAVQQRPRQQSRPMVLPLTLGSVAVCASARHPLAGRQGAVTLRLGAGTVLRGQRLAATLHWHV